MTEPDVIRIQNLLSNLGFYKGKSTGKADHSTRAAIRAFQKAKGLNVTGIVSLATRRAMFPKPAPAAQPVWATRMPPAPDLPATERVPLMSQLYKTLYAVRHYGWKAIICHFKGHVFRELYPTVPEKGIDGMFRCDRCGYQTDFME